MLLFIFLSLALCAVFYLYVKRQHAQFDSIPGPPTKFIVGNARELKSDYHKVQQNWAKQYGSVMRYFVGFHPVIMVSDPVIAKEVTTQTALFHNRTRPPIVLIGKSKGLLTLRDENWKRIRKTIVPTFNSNHLQAMMPLMNECTDLLMNFFEEKSKTGETIDINVELGKLTLDIIGSTAFGTRFDSQKPETGALSKAAAGAFQNATRSEEAILLLYSVPSFVANRLTTFLRSHPPKKLAIALNGVKVLGDQVNKILSHRRLNPTEEAHDFVNLLLKAEYNGEPLSDDEIRDNCITFLGAGLETTSYALAYTMYLLALNKDAEAKMVEEIKSVLGDEIPTTYDQLKQLKYVEMVINESLRIFPPAPVISRDTEEPVKIGQHTVPAGVEIQIPIYAMHHDPKNWPNPEKFDPERFRNFEPNSQTALTYLPFGYGHRACVGIRFAIIEAKLILARIYQKYTIDLKEGQAPLETAIGITMFPVKTIKGSVHRRK